MTLVTVAHNPNLGMGQSASSEKEEDLYKIRLKGLRPCLEGISLTTMFESVRRDLWKKGFFSADGNLSRLVPIATPGVDLDFWIGLTEAKALTRFEPTYL